MEWPQELISLFEDPLLEGVRPPAPKITANDRLLKELLKLEEWVEGAGREPSAEGPFEEKLMAKSLYAIKQKAADGLHEILAPYDTMHLLDT